MLYGKRDFYDKMVALVILPREKGTKLPQGSNFS
jgi:hypothetical protein